MRMLTIKANPKILFGIALALVGLIVVCLTFIGNHNGAAEKAKQASVSCQTVEERQNYLSSLGWQTDGSEAEKQITIPAEFNNVYTQYNKIQGEQGFDLTDYKGKPATVYTYNVINYQHSQNVVANLIVCNGELVAADLCDPSASNGFLIALGENEDNGTN